MTKEEILFKKEGNEKEEIYELTNFHEIKGLDKDDWFIEALMANMFFYEPKSALTIFYKKDLEKVIKEYKFGINYYSNEFDEVFIDIEKLGMIASFYGDDKYIYFITDDNEISKEKLLDTFIVIPQE